MHIARRAESARRAWQNNPNDLPLRRAFKQLRLQLIVVMKEQRTPRDWHQEESPSLAGAEPFASPWDA